MNRFFAPLKALLAVMLCFALIFSVPAAFAEEGESTENKENVLSIIDPDELRTMMDEYIRVHNLCPENISIGYCYTATGDRWVYNGGRWYYSASMYKVPLFMIYAQKVHDGELTQDSDINGISLADLETKVLVYSNNDFAHHAMNYLAGTPGQTHDGDRRVREMYQQFSSMPKEDYIEDFYDYSYFTPEFMMDVMETLYYESERFPNIIESLKLAQPDSYFNRSMAGRYEVAQKYGAFKEFNNTTGIIYTPNPFILTVMTEHMGVADTIISDCAAMFEKYTLKLDEKLEAFQKEEAEAEEQRLQEEQRAKEEAERLQQEKEEEERRKAEEEALRKEQERIAKEKAEKKAAITKAAYIAAAAAAVILLLILGIRMLRRKNRNRKQTPAPVNPKRTEIPHRKAEPELEKRNRSSKNRRGGDHYKPKH